MTTIKQPLHIFKKQKLMMPLNKVIKKQNLLITSENIEIPADCLA